MADERVKIIDIQVRYQDAVEGLAKFRSSLAEARKYQADLKKELKAGTITQEQYESSMAASNMYIKQQGDQMRELSKQVNNQIKATREQEGSLKQLRAELSNATQKWDAMSRAERESAKGHELKDHINQITSELKGAEEETQRFYRNVGNYKSATEGLETIRMKVADIGKQMLLALGGGSLLAFSKDVLQVTRDFQDGMARVRAVTNASAEDMKLMTDEARKMGRETIYHATDAAKAMENLARGGFDATEATTALSRTLQLAQANTISLDEASDLMIRTMRGFALPISEEEMVHANDVLSKTAASSATNVIELGEALKNAAPFGHALNQSVEEVNAALGVLADVGVRGADAGTALRMVILGLSSPTAKQQKVFKEFGIEINQQSLETEGLTKTLQRLKDSGIMEASNSAELLANVFGRRCTPQVMALVGNIDRLGEKLGTLQEAQGTTERMFEDSYSDVSKAIFTLSSAWESFKISLGESNNLALINPLKGLTESIHWLEENLPLVQNLIVTLLASISFAKLVKEAQTAFVTIRNSAVSNAEEASTTVRNLQNQEITLRKTVAAQEVALESASGTERTMLEAKVLANKRHLAETEKALVKAKLTEIQTWETAAAVNSGNAWKSAMAAASIAVSGFVTAAKVALKSFVFTAVIMLAFEALQKLFSLMGDSNSWFGKLTSSVVGFIQQGLNYLIKQFNRVSNWFKSFAEESKIIQIWIAVFKTELAGLINVFKLLWTTVKAVFSGIFSVFKAAAKAAGGLGEIFNGIFNFDVDTIMKGVNRLGDALATFFRGVWNSISDVVGGIGDAITDTVDAGVEAAKKAGRSKAFGGDGSNANTAAEGAKIGGAIAGNKAETTDQAAGEDTKKNVSKPTTYAEDAKKAKQDWDEAKAEYQRIIKDQNATTEEVLEARKRMSEAKKAYEDLTGTKQGKSGRQDSTAKKQAELERKAFEEAEKAMLDLMKDTAAKRRAQVEKQYNDEIRKLTVRLNTEKNLTEAAKEAIRKTILLKEQKKNEELQKLDEKELERQIQEQQKLTESRLSVVQKGSWQELQLKKDQLNEQLRLNQIALQREKEDRMADAEEKVRQAEEQYGVESTMAYEAAQEKLAVEQEFAERMANIREKARQDDLALDDKYRQQLIQQRELAFQNEATQFEIWSEERKLADMADKDEYIERELGFQQLNLEVVEEGELAVLAVRQQAAQEKYEAVVRAGQLEGETMEQYRARELAAEKAKVDAKLAFQNAEIKNRKAYYQSMRTLTNSLVSLTAAIGESDENFARLSKIITLAQITIDTGRAISAGVASASALPYPANLAAIATTIATVLANIATAVSTVKSANFAQGGKVTGPGTGTSDSIPANLSNGEFVMTAKATRIFEPLLAAMNDIGAGVVPMQATNAYRDYNMPTDELTESFKEAAESIHPVVSVVEIAERQREVEVVETLDNIE